MKDIRKTERLNLGIILNFESSWMGGIMYILNLIKILDFVDDEEKPNIILFYRSDLKKFSDQVNYPYFLAVEWNFPEVYIGYIKSWLSGKNIFIKDIIHKYALDGLYPIQDYPVRTRSKTKLVSWYADLQHEHYPQFFTRKKFFERTLRIKFILRNSDDLVVSSNAVADDFARFFKVRSSMKIYIFHFVSVIDDLKNCNIEDLRKEYKLPGRYFMISNQFYKHKNHRILLKAMVRLKEKGRKIHLAMTGRFPDASLSPYMQELHSLIDEHKLQSQISLLGIIPRDEQLFLMKHSQAIIQPSLFEGWSTVIEDAQSLQVPVVASDLPVNIEQLGQDGVYFEPNDDEKLAEILCKFPARNLSDVFYDEYSVRIKDTAKVFINIFRD